MNCKTLRTMALSALAVMLVLVACVNMAPAAHAASAGTPFSVPLGKPIPLGGSISSVRYGPAVGTQSTTE